MADIKKAKDKVLRELMDTMGEQSLKTHPKRMGVTIVIGEKKPDDSVPDESPLHESLETPEEEKLEQKGGDDDPKLMSEEEDIGEGEDSEEEDNDLMKRLKKLRSN